MGRLYLGAGEMASARDVILYGSDAYLRLAVDLVITTDEVPEGFQIVSLNATPPFLSEGIREGAGEATYEVYYGDDDRRLVKNTIAVFATEADAVRGFRLLRPDLVPDDVFKVGDESVRHVSRSYSGDVIVFRVGIVVSILTESRGAAAPPIAILGVAERQAERIRNTLKAN